MERDEVHHKMCKKVAQLTKVIFHLNTRSDEADLHLAAVTEAYEKEIEGIVRDANEKVKRVSEAAKAATGGQIAREIEALKMSVDQEKRMAIHQIEELRNRFKHEETKNSSLWQERISKMSADCLSLQQQAALQTTQFKEALANVKDQHANEESLTAKRHLTELEDQAIMLEAGFEEERRKNSQNEACLREMLNVESQQLARCEKKGHELEDSLAQCRRQLEDSLSKSSETMQSLQEERHSLRMQLETLRAEFDSFQKDAEKTALQASQALLEKEKQAEHWKEIAKDFEKTRRELAELKHILKAKEAEFQAELEAMRLAKEQIENKLKMDVGALEAETSAEQARLKESCQKLKERCKLLEDENAKLLSSESMARQQIETKKKEIGAIQGDLNELRNVLDRARAESADAASSHEKAIGNLQKELDSIREELAEKKRQFNEATGQVDQYKIEIAKLKEEMEAQVRNAGENGDQELEKARADHLAAIAELESKHKELTQQSNDAHFAELAGVRDAHEAAMQKLNADFETSRNSALAEKQALNDQLQELQRILSTVETDLTDSRAAFDDVTRIRKDLDAEIIRVRSEFDRMTLEYESKLRESEAKFQEFRQKLDSDSATVDARHRQELEDLSREHAETLRSKESELEAETLKFEEERRKLKEQQDADIKNADKLTEELRALRARIMKEVEQVRADGVEMMQRLAQDHEEKTQKLMDDHSSQLEHLRESLSRSHQERVDDMRQRHAKEIEELKNKFNSELSEKNASHEATVRSIRKEHEEAVRKLVVEAEQADRKFATEKSELQAELCQTSTSLEKEIGKGKLLENDLQDAKVAYAALEDKIRALARAHDDALQKKTEDFNREKHGLKEQHKTSIEKMLQNHIKETKEVKDQFERVKLLQDMQVQMLQDRAKELQELYDNRPSRPEDVERIEALEEDIRQKEATIKRMVEDMQFYKLELHNREQNYNKVFGAQPTVGIMNPMAQKRPSAGGAAAAPQMRIVQTGNGMQMGLPPLGGLPTPVPAPAGGNARKLQKRPSSGSIKRSSVE